MRRLALAVLVLASLHVPHATAADDGVRLPRRVPGRATLAPTTGTEWLDRQMEAASAGSPIGQRIQRRLDEARAHPTGQRYDWTVADASFDFDGDGVGDAMVFRLRFEMTRLGPEGDIDITLRSGKTGAKRWTHHYEDAVYTSVYQAKVGPAGKTGLLLVSLSMPSETERRVRVIGVDGRKGTHVFDKKLSTNDGLGDIQVGGKFDAFVRGGSDLLIGRVRSVASVPVTYPELQLYEVQPFAVDGANGTVRSLRDKALVVATGYTYLAAGDVDGDSRDDFLGVRRMLQGKGDVTAYGVVENEVHWTTDDVSVGWYVASGGVGDVAGDKREDVLLNTWVNDRGLLEIDGVTDGIPILDGPPDGIRGVLLDGTTGNLQWDRLDGFLGSYGVWQDVNHDHKADVLAVSLVKGGSRDGMHALVISGTGKVLRQRDVTVAAPIGRNVLGLSTSWAGDLDGDKVDDLAYYVVSASPVQAATASGFLLVGSGRAVASDDAPFYGTLDGGTAERVTYKVPARSTISFTFSDGWHGAKYWTLTAEAKDSGFGVGPQGGARGRCDGVVLYGYSTDNASWMYVLDGATGRVKWSATLAGTRPKVSLRVSGRHPRCR